VYVYSLDTGVWSDAGAGKKSLILVIHFLVMVVSVEVLGKRSIDVHLC